jgi:hypothetical protein
VGVGSHYVAAPPNPKATLALLARLEDLLDVALRLDDLPELARAWQRGVDELAAEDTEISEYIESWRLSRTRPTAAGHR